PAVRVDVVRHRRRGRLLRAGGFVLDAGRNEIVSVLCDVCANEDDVTDDALDGIASAIELRRYTLDEEILDSSGRCSSLGLSVCHVLLKFGTSGCCKI